MRSWIAILCEATKFVWSPIPSHVRLDRAKVCLIKSCELVNDRMEVEVHTHRTCATVDSASNCLIPRHESIPIESMNRVSRKRLKSIFHTHAWSFNFQLGSRNALRRRGMSKTSEIHGVPWCGNNYNTILISII